MLATQEDEPTRKVAANEKVCFVLATNTSWLTLNHEREICRMCLLMCFHPLTMTSLLWLLLAGRKKGLRPTSWIHITPLFLLFTLLRPFLLHWFQMSLTTRLRLVTFVLFLYSWSRSYFKSKSGVTKRRQASWRARESVGGITGCVTRRWALPMCISRPWRKRLVSQSPPKVFNVVRQDALLESMNKHVGVHSDICRWVLPEISKMRIVSCNEQT